MTSRDFAFWLQGYFEIVGEDTSSVLTINQMKIIKNHLNLVFKHEIDPSMGDTQNQQVLNEIHQNNWHQTVKLSGDSEYRPRC